MGSTSTCSSRLSWRSSVSRTGRHTDPTDPLTSRRWSRIMMTPNEMVGKILSDPIVKAEHDALEAEFALLDELLAAGQRAGLTQADVAQSLRWGPIPRLSLAWRPEVGASGIRRRSPRC